MLNCADVVCHGGPGRADVTYRTGVQDANLAGNGHGGWVMKLVR